MVRKNQHHQAKDDYKYIVKHDINKPTRQQRKLAEKQAKKQYKQAMGVSQSWSELKQMYFNGLSMFEPIKLLTQTIKTSEIVKYLSPEQSSVFLKLFEQLTRDAPKYLEELNKIYNIHKHRTGACELEDFNILMDTADLYYNWGQDYNNVIIPVYDHCVDLFRCGELNKKELEEQMKQQEKGVSNE